MRIALVLALAAGAVLAAPLAAREGSTRVPAAKAHIVKALQQKTRANGFGPRSAEELLPTITQVDINGDRIPDWQVDLKDIDTIWCGTGGCQYQLWLGRAKGAPVKVFDRRVRSYERQTVKGRIRFVFDLHGTYCDTSGSVACPGVYVWSPKRGRMVPQPVPGQVYATVGPIDTTQ